MNTLKSLAGGAACFLQNTHIGLQLASWPATVAVLGVATVCLGAYVITKVIDKGSDCGHSGLDD